MLSKWEKEREEHERKKREYEEQYNKHKFHNLRKGTKKYNTLLSQQGGACAICQRKHIILVVEHCHLTGRIRGLTCHRCNRCIAILEKCFYTNGMRHFTHTYTHGTWYLSYKSAIEKHLGTSIPIPPSPVQEFPPHILERVREQMREQIRKINAGEAP